MLLVKDISKVNKQKIIKQYKSNIAHNIFVKEHGI